MWKPEYLHTCHSCTSISNNKKLMPEMLQAPALPSKKQRHSLCADISFDGYHTTGKDHFRLHPLYKKVIRLPRKHSFISSPFHGICVQMHSMSKKVDRQWDMCSQYLRSKGGQVHGIHNETYSIEEKWAIPWDLCSKEYNKMTVNSLTKKLSCPWDSCLIFKCF